MIRSQFGEKKIFICGFMGCGKTTVGKLLSKKMNFSFKDTDSLIEQSEKMTVSEIFSIKGEKYFRSLETEILYEISSSSETSEVISTGGGIVLSSENFELMKKCGITIYLSSSPETILSRINVKTRPLLKNLTENQLKEKINSMLKERSMKYNLCDKIVETDGLTAEQVSERIFNMIFF
ncbi:shikimate kinase [Candidatus Dependentiae bacterium]|nr:shikimate kinase [Candidatus Dependentiae bacterium]